MSIQALPADAIWVRPAEDGDRRSLALLFAAVAEKREGIAAEPQSTLLSGQRVTSCGLGDRVSKTLERLRKHYRCGCSPYSQIWWLAFANVTRS